MTSLVHKFSLASGSTGILLIIWHFTVLIPHKQYNESNVVSTIKKPDNHNFEGK